MALPLEIRRVLGEKLADSASRPLPASTTREVRGALAMPGKATAVIGMRRAGKTTLLHQVRRELADAGIPIAALPLINFEDERLAGLEGAHLGFLLDEHQRMFPEAGNRVTWCFDEIQVVPGWERFVRRLLDRGDADVFVTGSSADLLSREVATALRGRAWAVPLYPFSFREALRHGAGEISSPAALREPRVRARVERRFAEWLVAGGFPEVQGLDAASRHQLLRDYVDVAMLRDVVERHEVKQVAALRWLVRHLLGNAASSFSVERFYAALKSQGLAISKDTVHHLLAHLEDCFLVRLVWMESTSERQRMVNPRKGYPVDTGLIPVFDRSGRANRGHALETAVLIELLRRRCEVTYVRNASGTEVDFLARGPEGAEELIQVCDDAGDPDTAARELRALAEAADAHPRATRRLLTTTPDGFPSDAGPDVQVQAAYEWMLEEPSTPAAE